VVTLLTPEKREKEPILTDKSKKTFYVIIYILTSLMVMSKYI